MSLLAAWVLFPAVLLALCGGVGLLVDLLSGRRLPGALVPPVGLAAIAVVAQFTTVSDATAKLTVPLVVLLAALGARLSFPWRFGRPDPWATAAALGVFLAFGAPVLLTGQPTFAGYIKLDDTATWLALTDHVISHGRDLGGLEPSSYRATLEANLPSGYPVGAFLPFGAAQKLVGGDLAWVFQPYLSFLAAMLSLCLWRIGSALVGSRPLRGLLAFLAAQPALLFGYALWGGIKELSAAVLVALAAALAPAALAAGPDGRRQAILLALPAGALIGVLSLGGLVWLGPMLLALAVLVARAEGSREMAIRGLALGVAIAALAVPVVVAGGFDPFQSGLTSESELGNLIHPLNPLQALGIWPSGDFRVDPSATVATAVLVALGVGAALAGLWLAWRRRAPAPLLFASALLAAAAVVVAGSPWVDAKALATVAPVGLTLALLGAVAALRVDRLAGVALLLLLAGGVVWSNALAYGGADLAPYDQLHELQRIGERFAGQGPALMTEYNPYGARHFLRSVEGEGASELRVRTVPLRTGGVAEKGESVDTDRIEPTAIYEYPLLVLRRSPVRSRPPSPYRLVWSGRYYEVWKRPASPAGPPPDHFGLGEGGEPSAAPPCGMVTGLGLLALRNGMRDVHILAAAHPPIYDATDGRLALPRRGEYEAWLDGSVRGSVELLVDGRRVGAARHQLENDGGFIPLGHTVLGPGRHHAELRFGGADLHPGSGGFPRPEAGPLLFTPAGEREDRLVSAPLARASRLCGRKWDWLEAVGR